MSVQKFQIDDPAWVMTSNKPKQITISIVRRAFPSNQDSYICYGYCEKNVLTELKEEVWEEKLVFSTKEELIKSL